MTLKVFETFAGIGAQHKALKNANINYEIVGISEIDKYAIQSYEAIHGEVNNYGDVSLLNPNDLPEIDLFTYSFPCQSISASGLQTGLKKGSGSTSSLLWECAKIIDAKRPKYLLMENVKNLISKKFMHDYQEWLNFLESLGYTNYWEVINAKDYGLAQNRERVFCVSILGDHKPFTFADKIPLAKTMEDYLEETVDDKFYLSDYVKRNLKVSVNFKTNIHKLGRYNDSQRGIIYHKSGICSTLMASDYKEAKVIGELTDDGHVTNLRKLTPREYWRLMGFTDEDFDKASTVCSNTQLYKQAGNSIAVPVLEMIFKQIKKTEV